jgi:hypothetical protein
MLCYAPLPNEQIVVVFYATIITPFLQNNFGKCSFFRFKSTMLLELNLLPRTCLLQYSVAGRIEGTDVTTTMISCPIFELDISTTKKVLVR